MCCDTAFVETRWGRITVERVAGRVTVCSLPFLEKEPPTPFGILAYSDDAAAAYIVAMLSGRQADRPPLAEVAGTAFQCRVWRAVETVKRGQKEGYGALARRIGAPGAARAVGAACGSNPVPLFVPCHRIVTAKGGLGGYAAGVPWKRWLLEHE